MRVLVACRLPRIALCVSAACPLLFASGLSALSLVVCDPSPPLMLVAFRLVLASLRSRNAPAGPLRAYAIPLSPHAESSLVPPAAAC